MVSPRHVAIVGNIGVGKTTLVNALSIRWGWRAVVEESMRNPYLHDFYGDMSRWGFHLQISFLHSRIATLKEIRSWSCNVVQDRTLYEDFYVFARNLLQLGLMDERDYTTYGELFTQIREFIRAPDLVVYLRCDVDELLRRIRHRNRSYERSITSDYLDALNVLYDTWMVEYDEGAKLILDVSARDMRYNEGDLGYVMDEISHSLARLDGVSAAEERG